MLKRVKRLMKKILPEKGYLGLKYMNSLVKRYIEKTKITIFYKGHRYYCPCCGQQLRKFKDYPYSKNSELRDQNRYPYTYKNSVCPFCNSFSRHRIICSYFDKHLPYFLDKEILVFSVERCTTAYLKRQGIVFKTADLYNKEADLCLDIQQLSLPTDSQDVILCNHVLEHLDDFRAALRELHRVLKPGGILELTVPMDPSYAHLKEDSNVVDAGQRAELFGQYDHLRVFGTDFRAVLENEVMQSDEITGFEIDEIHGKDMDSRIRPETGPADYDMNLVYICRKVKSEG